MPTRLIFYDCETARTQVSKKVVTHSLKLGYACAVTRYNKGKRTKEKWCKFTTIEEFWNFVFSFSHKKTKTYLIAQQQHFDFMIVDGFSYLAKEGWIMSFPILDSNLFIVSFRKEGRTVEKLQLENYLRERLYAMTLLSEDLIFSKDKRLTKSEDT